MDQTPLGMNTKPRWPKASPLYYPEQVQDFEHGKVRKDQALRQCRIDEVVDAVVRSEPYRRFHGLSMRTAELRRSVMSATWRQGSSLLVPTVIPAARSTL